MVFVSSDTGYSSRHFSGSSSAIDDAVVDKNMDKKPRFAALPPTSPPTSSPTSPPSLSSAQSSSGITLPLIKSEAFISQRHEVNPAIALNLLQEIQSAITTWQMQQRQIIQTMQALYTQGPMVDGWLQSSLSIPATPAVPTEATLLRHGDADALMRYVEAMENNAASMHSHSAGHLINDCSAQRPHESWGETTQYSLCSLAKDGSVRSQPCPPEQMAVVSSAIARYQKFKQLMVQKQSVEAKLTQVVSQLTDVRAEVRADVRAEVRAEA